VKPSRAIFAGTRDVVCWGVGVMPVQGERASLNEIAEIRRY
jgi:hypothetical protein